MASSWLHRRSAVQQPPGGGGGDRVRVSPCGKGTRLRESVVARSRTCRCGGSGPDCLQDVGRVGRLAPHADLPAEHQLLLLSVADPGERLAAVDVLPGDVEVVQVPDALVAHYASETLGHNLWADSGAQPGGAFHRSDCLSVPCIGCRGMRGTEADFRGLPVVHNRQWIEVFFERVERFFPAGGAQSQG
jgi:hypothetical protein